MCRTPCRRRGSATQASTASKPAAFPGALRQASQVADGQGRPEPRPRAEGGACEAQCTRDEEGGLCARMPDDHAAKRAAACRGLGPDAGRFRRSAGGSGSEDGPAGSRRTEGISVLR